MVHKEKLGTLFLYSIAGAICFVMFFGALKGAHAQQGLPGFSFDGASGVAAPALEVRPRFPSASTEVTLTLPGTVGDTSGGIRWYVNNVERPEFRNTRSATTTSGVLGSATRVEVVVTGRNGARTTLSHTITPTEVDFIVEANTLVPYFYKGRALPSRGAETTITAIPHLNTPYARDTLSYKWTVDREVIGGGSARGNDQITISSPHGRTSVIILDIFDPAGILLVTKLYELASFDPIMRFYEANPLRGFGEVALTARGGSKPEYALRAMPYYLDTRMLKGEHRARWSVNGREVESESDDPLSITLRNTSEEPTSATVSFSFNSLVDYLQFAEGGIQLDFE